MANLLGQNIGTNYKGILNLNTLNGNLTTTLEAITDGDGNASPLRLSTTQVSIGIGSIANGVLSIKTTQANTNGTIAFLNNSGATIAAITDTGSSLTPMVFRATEYRFTDATGLSIGRGYSDSPSARLHVRGDGTNPIGRFENATGAALLLGTSSNATRIWSTNSSSVTLDINVAGAVLTGQWGTGSGFAFNVNNGVMQHISGTSGLLSIFGNFSAPSSSTGFFRPIEISYTVGGGATNTSVATGIFLNATETALNGMTHNLMDLQVGNVSAFRIGRNGVVTTSSGVSSQSALMISRDSNLNAVIGVGEFAGNPYGSTCFTINANNNQWEMWASNAVSFGFYRNSGNPLLRIGGSTNAFPAIKRNGAAIDFRLADDSAFCDINSRSFYSNGNQTSSSGPFLALNQLADRIIAVNAATQQYQAIGFTSNGGTGDTSLALFGLGTGGGFMGSIRMFTSNNSRTPVLAAIIDRNQSVGIGLTNSTDLTCNASAILQADSTTKGFLLPRMTEAQRDLIASPATGLLIYNTTTNVLNFYNGSAWGAV